MRRFLFCALAGCALLHATAYASEAIARRTQGNWQGQFTSGPWEGEPLNARIIATDEDKLAAQLFWGAPGVDTPRVDVPGVIAGRDAAFDGDVVLPDALGGGNFHVTAEAVKASTIEGAFSSGEESSRFTLERVELGSPTLGEGAPYDAIVLYDGENLDHWQRYPLKWTVTPDGFQVAGSNLITKEEFGSFRLHLEFRTPFMPKSSGQSRGNSGVYIHGRYEIQVLDSFGEPPADDFCGGIYSQAVPRVNASLPPLEWQTYDIWFTAPTFGDDGLKSKNAHIKVEHNGILIHDTELTDVTPGGIGAIEVAEGPILLQDHGDAVRYRNIWLQPLGE